ncbi:TIGR03086 family metal-binding protein [Dactylosporangium sp. NBC_01737]|uniref:TIGR03086 family metal-binding protein n=1 Tax=Dactylosporangium sp. NBC_01737 TaxID=2975959 RepID=UPI002E15FE88|nr:TIGR03086 family metal-binding protein [Dactylosporangium sp. NBC_01737]
MDGHLLIGIATPVTLKIVDGIDSLDAPTPCTGWDVRALVNHLLHWGPVLAAAARKEALAPGPAVDRTGGDWRALLRAQIDATAGAWSDPAAWEGTTRMGGPMELPADLIGGMVLGELVLHGWDLARASRVDPHWDDTLVLRVYDEIARCAVMGREMGVYAAEVPVLASAPTLARALGLSGRDPAWTP